MSAIARLAAVADINICHELVPKCSEMIEKLSLPQSLTSPTDTITSAFEKWLAGKSRLPPTWEQMIAVLREIEMNDLAVRIKRYFGTTSENGLFLCYEINIVHSCQNDD